MTPTGHARTTVTAYLLDGPRKFERQEIELPELPRDWVRVRYLYCGICGSDVSKFEGRRGITYPESLGHEFVAEVVASGSGSSAFSPGDLVTSDLNYRCGDCDQCRSRRSHLCHEGQAALFTNRGFSTLGDLHKAYLILLSGSSAPAHLALAEPLSCVLHAAEWAHPSRNERVLVLGAGGLGCCMAFALDQRGTPFDLVDLCSSRVTRLKAATDAVVWGGTKAQGDYDVVFDLSGSESGLRAACEHTRSGGRLCTMSHLDGYTSGDFLLASLTRRDITFTVSYLNGERDSLRRAVTMLEGDWSDAWNRVIQVVHLGELPAAFENRRRVDWCKTVVAIDAVGD